MYRSRNVKIVATLGSASTNCATIEALLTTGGDVFSLNSSHATHEGDQRHLALIRTNTQEWKRPLSVLSDLKSLAFRLDLDARR